MPGVAVRKQLWDIKTTECVRVMRAEPASMADITVHAIALAPRNPEHLLVCNRSNTLYVLTLQGQLVKKLSAPEITKDLVAFCVSPRGELVFCAGEDRRVYCFKYDSGRLMHSFEAHERDIIGLSHHPHESMLATFSEDGTLKLWKAQ